MWANTRGGLLVIQNVDFSDLAQPLDWPSGAFVGRAPPRGRDKSGADGRREPRRLALAHRLHQIQRQLRNNASRPPGCWARSGELNQRKTRPAPPCTRALPAQRAWRVWRAAGASFLFHKRRARARQATRVRRLPSWHVSLAPSCQTTITGAGGNSSRSGVAGWLAGKPSGCSGSLAGAAPPVRNRRRRRRPRDGRRPALPAD